MPWTDKTTKWPCMTHDNTPQGKFKDPFLKTIDTSQKGDNMKQREICHRIPTDLFQVWSVSMQQWQWRFWGLGWQVSQTVQTRTNCFLARAKDCLLMVRRVKTVEQSALVLGSCSWQPSKQWQCSALQSYAAGLWESIDTVREQAQCTQHQVLARKTFHGPSDFAMKPISIFWKHDQSSNWNRRGKLSLSDAAISDQICWGIWKIWLLKDDSTFPGFKECWDTRDN